MNRHRLITLFSLFLILLAALTAFAAQSPTNVILLVGDGMGLPHITLARLSLAESSRPLNIDSMPHAAFVKSHSADSVITDSAAAATALATGCKTNNGMISTLPDGREVQTILEAAQAIGKSAGLVTTTTITHATPAAFGSHVSSRKGEADIAPQYLEKRIDVLLGGGRMYFLPKSQEQSKREDERNLLDEAKALGYTVVDSREGLLSAKGGRLLGLFQMSSLTTKAPEPTLAEMTQKAIDVLSADKDGFFLMVEGGQIDWTAHNNDEAGTLKQLFDFDAAVGKALEFARKRTDTLVIVTADHETGGLTIIYPDKGSDARFKCSWSTKGHSGCNVPLLAEGPGASLFSGVLDNTDVPKRIASLWRIKGFAKP